MIGKIKKVGSDLLFHAINHSNVHDAIALIEEGEADVNCTNINGQTPLHYAVNVQNITLVEILLQYGANPNTQENAEIGKNTPFHKAVEKGMLDAVQLFLRYGGDPTIKNKAGFSSLHIAARDGRTEIVKVLVAAGVETGIRDSYGFNPAYWAKQNKHAEVLKYLGEPQKITKEEFYDHVQQMWDAHGFKPGGKKKKKKGKKKK